MLGIVALAIIIGGVMLAQGSLFHSYETCSKDPSEWGPGYCGDPVTTIWKVTGSDASLDEFNSVRTVFCTCTFGPLTNEPGFFLEPNGTQTAVALTKSPIGDLGIIAAKQMFYRAQYLVSGPCCGSPGGLNVNSFGFYLTTNKTVPTELGYNPLNDRSVSMVIDVFNSAANTFSNFIFMQREIGTSIASQNFVCGSSGSCYVGGTDTIDPTTTRVTLGAVLNYTTQGTLTNACSGSLGGPGCSELAIGPGTQVPPTVNLWSQQIPWFRFQGEQYYAGFFSLAANSAFSVYFNYEFTTGGGQFEPNDVAYYVPGPNCSGQSNGPCNPDAGGFFGPVIKALISIGVFILANIIAFGNYLGTLMQPVWAFLGALASVVLNGLSSFIITLLNALGSLIGDPNLGDQLVSIFTQIGSYITALFTKINALVSSLITFLINSFNFLFDAVNGILTYWIGTVLFGILGVLVTISNIIVTVLKVFQVAFPFVVLADLLWLLSESIDHGTEGAMKWWAPHEILVVNVGKLMFILVETLSTFIYQTITEIEGGVADIKPDVAGFSP